MNPNSNGYGDRTLIQYHALLESNSTNRDLIPKVSLTYDCCELFDKSIKIDDITLDVSIQHVVSNFNDLKLASHKIDELEKAIDDQEWKITHSTKVNSMFISTYIGAGIVIIISSKKSKCFRFFSKCCDRDYSKSICFKLTIINRIQTRQEETTLPPVMMSDLARRQTSLDKGDQTPT